MLYFVDPFGSALFPHDEEYDDEDEDGKGKNESFVGIKIKYGVPKVLFIFFAFIQYKVFGCLNYLRSRLGYQENENFNIARLKLLNLYFKSTTTCKANP